MKALRLARIANNPKYCNYIFNVSMLTYDFDNSLHVLLSEAVSNRISIIRNEETVGYMTGYTISDYVYIDTTLDIIDHIDIVMCGSGLSDNTQINTFKPQEIMFETDYHTLITRELVNMGVF